MTKFKKILFSTMALIILTALPMAYAQNTTDADAHAQGGHYGQRIQEIYNQLQLTDDQKKQLETNKKQHRENMKSTWQQIKADREALQAELMKPQLDISRVNKLHGQIKALQSQEEDIKLSSILAVRAILTPEQFTKFINLMHKRKQEHD